MTLEAAFGRALAEARRDRPFDTLTIAVSGGGDSMALLLLAQEWARSEGVLIDAVTVDHGLRAAARDEARFVAEICDGLAVEHATLTWDGWDGAGNLQAEARRARYGLIADHARRHGRSPLVLVGHTMDDAAETILMRLARGSGVDGLSHMRAAWDEGGVRFRRPLLGQARAELRDWLRVRGQRWIDDPTNDDETYDRVRIRKALDILSPLGIDAVRLSATGHAMAEARQALTFWAHRAALEAVRVEAGDVLFDRARWADLPDETADRLFAHAILWVSGAAYRPRRASLQEARAAALAQGRATLNGCLIDGTGDHVRVMREPRAVSDCVTGTQALWDGRWRLVGPSTGPNTTNAGQFLVRALGEAGLGACPDWRETGLPRMSLLASPAVFDGDRLVSAPLAGQSNGWSVELENPRGDFFSSLLSH